MSSGVWVAVALGGALGSMLRYGVGIVSRSLCSGWPWGTWTVNVVGSFAIGLLVAAFVLRPVPDWVRFGLITGVLGGFTTFSAFSVETIDLLRTSGLASAGVYVVATLIAGLAACMLGALAARALLA